jgi:signal transduction histidine kinase
MLILHNIAICKGQLGQYKEAKQVLKKTIPFFKGKEEELRSQMLREAAEVYSKYGDDKEAYQSLLEATNIEEELKGIEKQKIVAELEAQYELNDKQAQIAAKELENKLQQERFNVEQKQKYLFLALMSLSLILAVWAITNYRSKNKLNQILTLQKTELTSQKTELENQTMELKKLNQIKDKLFTIVAHDLKQPALAFQKLGSTIHHLIKKNDIERLEKVGKYASIMSSNLHLTIENLFRWGTLQQNHVIINAKDTDVHSLMISIYEEFEPLAHSKDIKLSLDVPNQCHTVTDSTILTSILRNLLSNAIKFTSAGKDIKIEARNSDQNLIIQIKDKGIGIPIEIQKDLFGLNPSKKRDGTSQEHGSGLGLMLCKQLAELAKIRLAYDSTEGVGTTFNVTV